MSELMDWSKYLLKQESCPLCRSINRNLRYTKLCAITNITVNIFECLGCEFVYSGTYLDLQGSELFYEEKYKSSNYVEYGKNKDLKLAHFSDSLRFIKKLVNPGKRLLDMGCGEGLGVSAALSFNYEAYGIDISHTAIAKGQHNKVPNIYLSDLTNAASLGLGNFDVITLFDVLDHVSFPDKIVKNVSENLTNGGIAYIEVCDIKSFYAKLMGRNYTHIIPLEHVSYFSKKTIAKLLSDNNMSALEIRNLNRDVSLAFLTNTLLIFNPRLGRFFQLLSKFLPRKALNYSVSIPIGVLSIVAQKQNLGEKHV